MSTSPKIGLPYVASQQAQPEVTHNEALLLLQALLVGVLGAQNSPPGSPAAGDSYIVGTSPTGAWVGHANAIAIRDGSSWKFVPGRDSNGSIIAMGASQEGLRVWRSDIDAFVVWSGAAWAVMPVGQLRSATVSGLAGMTPTAGAMAYCTDESGGAVPVFGDGSAWRRVTDRTVAS